MSPIILSKTVWGSDKYGISFWTPGFNVVGYDHDQCFQLTNCEASIDVEKYVLDQKNQEWIDADEESTAIDLPICTDAKFKIVIHNDGNTNLYDIIVKDKMHESLKFITGEPLPDQWYYASPTLINHHRGRRAWSAIRSSPRNQVSQGNNHHSPDDPAAE